ncbi:MAG: hypothetical protein QNJ88_09975 [Acidimicrobiia bacterium]|nr:hypothetical protein [Acidimicrobiia bacterium]
MIKRIGLALTVVAVLAFGTVAASAQAPPEESEGTGVVVTAAPATKAGKFVESDEYDDGKFEDEELPAEFVEEMNAETDALVEYLRGLGFTVDVERIELRKPVFDEEDDAIWEAIDAFYAEQFASEIAAWTDEEKAEWNAEIDEFVAWMAEEGITVEITELAPGVYDIVWTEELDKALWELEENFEDEDFQKHDDEELTPELIEEINAETDALVEYLRGLGFTVDVETDENGIREPVFDDETEAIWEAIDAFYAEQFAAEIAAWTDEEKAEWNAEIDEFVAWMAEEGITVETTEIAPGVYDIVWTEELEKALWELEKDYDEDEEDFEADEEPENEDV